MASLVMAEVRQCCWCRHPLNVAHTCDHEVGREPTSVASAESWDSEMGPWVEYNLQLDVTANAAAIVISKDYSAKNWTDLTAVCTHIISTVNQLQSHEASMPPVAMPEKPDWDQLTNEMSTAGGICLEMARTHDADGENHQLAAIFAAAKVPDDALRKYGMER
jgi:hypothetical protein